MWTKRTILAVHHSGADRGQQNVTHGLPDVIEVGQHAAGFPFHADVLYGCHTGAPVFPPLSPGWICECSTLPFEERLPPVCSTPPFIVPPWATSSCAVLSSAVHSASGESNRIFTDALMVAVCMPFAVSAPVYGSYSITAPSGND